MPRKDEKSEIGEVPFSTVAVAGLGLLGGSLALALKKRSPAVRVLGLARRRESIDQALSASAIDSGSVDANIILPEADLTVVCMPVNSTIEFCREHASLWRSGSLVTDVGSTKGEIMDSLSPALKSYGIDFIGSHPMAGSEKNGFAAAFPDLYRDAAVLLTVADNRQTASHEENLRKLTDFWRGVEAIPTVIETKAHDALVARTSHFLHLVAPALLSFVLNTSQSAQAAAGSFRDMTRIAASSPEMWLDIFQHNKTNVLSAANEFQDELNKLVNMLQNENWKELNDYLFQARQKRVDWEKRNQADYSGSDG